MTSPSSAPSSGSRPPQGDLATLGDRQIAVSQALAQGKLSLGDDVKVTYKDGTTADFTVGAITQFSLDVPGYIISSSAATAALPDLLPSTVAITVQPGQLDAVKSSLDQLTAPYSSIAVEPGNSLALAVKGVFNALISSVNALLGLAVIIAVFGIVNTLILSVTERTPEIGLLRSIGMTRGQLRRSIRSEAVIVSSDGTVIGIVFGLFVAWAVTQPLFADGEHFSWPLRELALVALLGVIIGIIASVIPAWRASRLDVLDAVRQE